MRTGPAWPASQGKAADYGTQLHAKQTLKGGCGNIAKHHFRNIYAEAERKRGNTGEDITGLLEHRLDAVVYRSKMVPTVFAACQFDNHDHVAVNGQCVMIASALVNDGDVVSVRRRAKEMALVLEAST